MWFFIFIFIIFSVMKKKILYPALFFFLSIAVFAQEKKQAVRSFQLENYLLSTPNQNENISFFVKANPKDLKSSIEENKGKYKGHIKGWQFISIPRNNINNFLENTTLSAINFRTYKGKPMNDTMRVNNRINQVHQGLAPLESSYSGKGVIMGFIDTGLDWSHPDFLNPSDSSTRVISIWDQTKPFNQFTPPKYGYGQEWNSSEIMQGMCTNNDQYGHGTTVTGAGCGNGFANGLNKGVAYESEIIAVESNFNSPNWLASVVDAVEYIYHIADSLDKPCALNASVGTYLGSHDGLDPYALFIDSLINQKAGHLMVASAGNSGDWGNYHLETTLNNDTAFTWFSHNPNSGFGGPAVYFEIWADTINFNQLNYAIGLDKISSSVENRGTGTFFNISHNLNSVTYDTIRNQNNDELATVQYWSEVRDGQYFLQVYIPAPDSSQYNFRFETRGTGSYDSWSSSIFGMSDIISLPNTINGFLQANKYINPDSLKTIVSSFQCLPSVITVGNYYNDSGYVNLDSTWTSNGGVRGKIAETSSRGPTRDNRMKPEIAASGHGVNAPLPLNLINYYLNHPTLDSTLALGGMHRRNGGTSMASPIVAGVGALLLEKCNKMSSSQFKAAVIAGAYNDNFTGNSPNYSFGYGKLDGLNTLASTNFSNDLIGDLEFCDGDSSSLSISNHVSTFNWNDSDTNSTYNINSTSSNFLVTVNSLGCNSDTLYFQSTAQLPPNTPIITIDFDSIIIDNPQNSSIQWFYDDIELILDEEPSLGVNYNGNYYVILTNQYGCSSTSDTLSYNMVGINEHKDDNIISPNPANDFIQIQNNTNINTVKVYNLEGKLIFNQEIYNHKNLLLDISKWSNGTYFIKLFTSQNIDVKKIVVQH